MRRASIKSTTSNAFARPATMAKTVAMTSTNVYRIRAHTVRHALTALPITRVSASMA